MEKNKKINWPPNSNEWLIANYPNKGRKYCAEYLGVSLSAIKRKVSKLNLSFDKKCEYAKEVRKRAALKTRGVKRPRHSEIMKGHYKTGRMNSERIKNKDYNKMIRDKARESFELNGPSLGFTGKKHTKESKKIMSEKSASLWKSHGKTKIKNIKKKAILTMIRNKTVKNTEKTHSRGVSGKRIDLDNQFFRSKAEANFARYLKFIGIAYEYEKKHFFFDGIRKGCVSYTPDFYIPEKDLFIEFKGWLDARSITKLKRFKKYYPIEFSKLTIVKQKIGKNDIETLKKIGFSECKIESFSKAESLKMQIPFWEH